MTHLSKHWKRNHHLHRQKKPQTNSGLACIFGPKQRVKNHKTPRKPGKGHIILYLSGVCEITNCIVKRKPKTISREPHLYTIYHRSEPILTLTATLPACLRHLLRPLVVLFAGLRGVPLGERTEPLVHWVIIRYRTDVLVAILLDWECKQSGQYRSLPRQHIYIFILFKKKL